MQKNQYSILFPYKLNNQWDKNARIQYIAQLSQKRLSEENLHKGRILFEKICNGINLQFEKRIKKCQTEIIKYSPSIYGSDCMNDLEIHIHRIQNNKNRAAIIFVHGGGGVMQDPQQYYFLSSNIALQGEVTVFSIQYRLAPETKVPGSIMDVYAAVKYIYANCSQFDLDAKAIGLYGISGGGFIVSGVSYHMAMQNESFMIKTIFLDVPQLFGDHWWTKDFEHNEVEKNHQLNHLSIFKMLTGSDQKDKNNIFHYTPDMPIDMLKRLPPHAFLTHEFDYFIRDTLHFCQLLKEHGKLLDICVNPGTFHLSPIKNQDLKKMLITYLNYDRPSL